VKLVACERIEIADGIHLHKIIVTAKCCYISDTSLYIHEYVHLLVCSCL